MLTLLVCLVVLVTPWLLFFVIADVALWIHVLSVDVLKIPYTPYKLKGRNRHIAMGALTAFFVLFLAGTSLFLVIGTLRC